MLLAEADVHPDSRSYMLSVEDFDRLCTVYKRLCDKHSGLFEFDYRASKVERSVDEYCVDTELSD